MCPSSVYNGRTGAPISGFYERFSSVAETYRDRIAVEVVGRDGVDSWTYGRLRDHAESMARSLASRGVRRGDRCALLSENCGGWCAAYLGMLRLGAIPVPLDTTYTDEQVAKLVADCGAKTIVVSKRFAPTAARLPAELACAPFPLDDPGAPDDEAGAPCPEVALAPEETAAILYTSGTTSDPKGVVLTHGNLRAEIDSALAVVTVKDSDAVLGVLPLFHALAQLANFLLPLSVGARVVFLDAPSSAELLRAFDERGITVFCCVPQFFYLIHQRVLERVSRAGALRRLAFRTLLSTSRVLREWLGLNLGPRFFPQVHRALGRRMRLLVTGGSGLNPRIGRDLYALGFDLLQAYGLTETCGGATVLRMGDRHVASVGQPLPGIEIKILPTDLTADPDVAGHGEAGVGEVAIRGPMISPGYYKRDDVNAVTFRDGWLHTGDLGYLDRAGRLYITGRAKEVIVLGSGKNLYPEEIEAHYAQSPFIKELCVLGREDTAEGGHLHAVVVPDFEVLRERKIFNSRDVLRFEIESLSARLPAHKRILSYDVVAEDLPRTTTRKLKRFEIGRRLKRARHDAPGSTDERGASAADATTDAAWADDPQASRTLAILREFARESAPLAPSSNLELDVGLDSMGRVELLAALEARLGIAIADETAHGIHTVGELVRAARDAGGAAPVEADAEFDPWRKILDSASEDDPAVAPILVPRPVVSLLLYLSSRLLYAVSWLLLGMRVSGREHLPRNGPFLICPNHQSYLDAFLLASTLPFRVFRRVFYVGASEYFSGPLSAWLARMIHVVPVDPDTNLVGAMRAGAFGLRNEKLLILFPEGERSIDAEIKTFKKGAAILSLNVGAPVVPVALDGLHDVWPRGGAPRLTRLLPFSGTRARVRFGPALPPGHAGRTDVSYEALTARLRDAVSALLRAARVERD